MYDFTVFGYYAWAIGKTFFPSGDVFVSLMLSLMTFGVGFLMRPVGSIVLGAYADKHGRRAGLILTMCLMSFGIVSVACVPGYASIGLLAPLLVVVGRLTQGFSAGMELGAVSVYLSEISTPGHKGFYVSWQSASQQVAVMFAALLGVLLNSAVAAPRMAAWGWRIPPLVGCLIIPFLLWLRRSLRESYEFAACRRHPTFREIVRSLASSGRLVVIATMVFTMTSVSFYMITAYTPTFGSTVLRLSALYVWVVTFCVGASNLVWIPVMGAVSDRIGRHPLMIASTVLMAATAYPALVWLVRAPSFSRLLIVELWLSFVYGTYNGAAIVFVTEIMPIKIRVMGFSLAYSMAAALFGGFTPAICTYLIRITRNGAVPGLWLSFAAACGLAAALIAERQLVRATPSKPAASRKWTLTT